MDFTERVRDILAALAGAAAIIYIAGGLIVALRLILAGLPPFAVVGQLSRNVLLSVAVGEGLSPVLFLAAVYAAMRSAIHSGDSKDIAKRLQERTYAAAKSTGTRPRYVARTLTLAAVIVAPAIIDSALRDQSAIPSKLHLIVVLAGSMVLAWLGMLLYPNLRGLIAKTYSTDLRSIPATVLHSMLLAVVLIPGAVAFWGTQPLEEAVLCTTRAGGADGDLRGYLVGQTTDDAFIGEATGSDRRIISVPTAQIRRVIIGPKAIRRATCPV